MSEPALFSDDDAPRTFGLLAAFDIDTSGARSLTIPWQTKAKGRPKFNQRSGTAYTAREDKEAEAETARFLRHLGAPAGGAVAVAAIFYRDSTRRVDGDNLLKHLLDAANGVVWVDDAQVTGALYLVELDRARPRTVIAVAPHRSSMPRDVDPERLRAAVVGDDPLRRALAEEAERD